MLVDQTLGGTGWSVALDPDGQGEAARWTVEPPAQAIACRVPSLIQESFPAQHGLAWYWLRFQAPAAAPSRRRFLGFDSISYQADVWLNGTHVGAHEGAQVGFSIEVTDALRVGRENLLAVRVLNPTREPILGMVLGEIPSGNGLLDDDYRPGSGYVYGGITGNITLWSAPRVRIDDLNVVPDPETGRVTLAARVVNARSAEQQVECSWVVESSAGVVVEQAASHAVAVGDTTIDHALDVPEHSLWSLETPVLYRLTLTLSAGGESDRREVRFGFRDFRVGPDGRFRLNGKPLWLRSTHTGNHTAVMDRDRAEPLLRQDLINAKMAGFDMVRFISSCGLPWQLDLCDEIGLMVYEEHGASWLLRPGEHLAERFRNTVSAVVRRDRNHPSIAIWGFLNETFDGPTFREAAGALPWLRELDRSRLVLLSSGRWDGHREIGSVSNPGSDRWEPVWGLEAEGAQPIEVTARVWGDLGGYAPGAGDAHLYPPLPQSEEVDQIVRGLGQEARPVFLSEYGAGSLFNVLDELAGYRRAGADLRLAEPVLMQRMADGYLAAWERFGLGAVYSYPEDLLRESWERHARHRLEGINVMRSNPRIIGYNLTGILDHAVTGEGLWSFWRRWKPGTVDALADGFAKFRWCLHVTPRHGFTGSPVHIEALLADEEQLVSGGLEAQVTIRGEGGEVWRRSAPVGSAADSPVVPVLSDDVCIHAAGTYELRARTAELAPAGGRHSFHISDAAAPLRPVRTVSAYGLEEPLRSWLAEHGVSTGESRVALVAGPDARLDEVTASVASGGVAILLDAAALAGQDGTLPMLGDARLAPKRDWLYHGEVIALPSPVWEGVAEPGMLDWYWMSGLMPFSELTEWPEPESLAAVEVAPGWTTHAGFRSGVHLAAFRSSRGHVVVNTFPVAAKLERNPLAGRLLLNLIRYGSDLS